MSKVSKKKMGEKPPQVGLNKLRKVSGREPTYQCENCNCKRYSKCDCMKKGDKSHM